MKVVLFDTHSYERESFSAANDQFGHALTFLEPRLTRDTAALAAGHQAVCAFVNDRLDAPALQAIAHTHESASGISRSTGSWGSTCTARRSA
ncbi:MAG TPA: hypothetical protein VES67_05180 [Vicinamibacterales bacterium]|nr:hypothetical protein [Vicinamibacterales bacterium]